MANFIDYIRWRGDISFLEKGLNEVDALIFNEMVYMEFDQIVGGMDSEKEITLEEAYERYREKNYDQSSLSNDPRNLVEKMVGSHRFQKIRLKYYVKETRREKEVQFAAVTICLGDESVYVAFRGTDNTLVGWREDFNLSFKAETTGQSAAVEYLKEVFEKINPGVRVYVGGHSKGGNLAVYASAFCGEKYRERIKEIYSNDGPGMNKKIADRKEYRTILPKVRLSIPESSLVGILFSNTDRKDIVKSDATGGSAQHNPYTWQVLGDHFVKVDAQSEQSIFLNGTLNEWLNQMDDGQKEEFTRTIFEILEASGASTLAEINSDRWVSYNAILKAAFKLDPESQKVVRESLKELALISRDAFWNEAQKAFERIKNDI